LDVLVGANLIVNDATPSIIEIAQRAEARGIESLFQGEHTHTPVATVHPATVDGQLPDFYKRFPDVFITLAAAAAVTSTIRLGTGVVLVAEHNVLQLAKSVASLDQLSGGRVEFGVGYGWNALELANNGVAWTDRRAVFGEKLAALKQLWTEEVVGYQGKFVSFSDSWMWPKPLQAPHPPILIGANGNRATLRDVVGLADGWYPMEGPDLPAQFEALQLLAEESGRPTPMVSVNIMAGQMPGAPWYLDDRAALDRLIVAGERYREMGIYRIVVGVPMDNVDDLTRGLDVLAMLTERLA
jgi:probable F420-dependent oxidoreductase